MLDARVFAFLFELAHKNQFLDWLLIFLAQYLIFILGVVFVRLIIKERDWRQRFYFSTLAIISVILSRGIITTLIRFYYEKPRPFVALDISPLIGHAATPSFPSGHLAFIVPLVLVAWLISRRAGIWLLAGTILIGLARVAIGVHWPSDILGGFLIGAVSFAATYYLLKRKRIIITELKNKNLPPKTDSPSTKRLETAAHNSDSKI